ncbi:hypothetical protein BJF90_08175 [Pseudonocardia sp. CNS-004]|nr:hypothetical protein BJF90_08175 [Pseudonocardia sp. CNS-004]
MGKLIVRVACFDLIDGDAQHPGGHLLTPPHFRTPPLNGHLEVGRTYRLRIGEIEPLFGPTFLRIIKIE